jgi:tetratricopeptide (TPR) repeat protein
MKIFFSYPHDSNAPLVERIKADLEARGHEVWYDADQIKSGDDWRNAITRGILDSQQVVAFLSKHAVRDPGVCLNEIAIALADKGEAMVTVLVEPESEVSAPVSITHIQWLKMEDWQAQAQDDGWYRTQLDRLIDAIENPSHAGRNEELETLKLALDPMSFYAEIAPHIPGFTGRRWIIDRYTTWLADEPQSRVLRIEGGPGLGKTAVASYLAHSTKSSVLAVHLCQYNKGESRNTLRLVRTLAYQLATRLPDYRARLIKSVAIQHPETMQGKDPASLWGELISAPLSGVGKGTIDRQRLAIIIDGLDEATVEGKNPIVELLATEINQLPKWIGVVLTGRPDPELTQRLARYKPLVLRDDDPQNIADLKVYVDVWLALEVTAGKLTPTQANAASEALLARSQGAFLYLSQARIAVAENMLDLTQPTLFPSGLTEIYQRFFERRFPDAGSDDGRYKAKVRPLLELVLASPEPLPLSIAKEILKWGAYDGPEVIKSLGSLLKRTKDGLAGEDEETLAPFHNSVREWLQDPNAAGDFHVSAEEARMPLTEAVWRRYADAAEKDYAQMNAMDVNANNSVVVWSRYYNYRADAYAMNVLPELLCSLKTLQLEQILGDPNPSTEWILYGLAKNLSYFQHNESSGKFEPNAQLIEQRVEMFEVHVQFAESLLETGLEDLGSIDRLRDSYGKLGHMHLHGDTHESMRRYQQGLNIAKRLAENYPENDEFASALAESHDWLFELQKCTGNFETALDLHTPVLEIRERLAKRNPETFAFQYKLSDSYIDLGELQYRLGNLQDALMRFQQALTILERLADEFLGTVDWQNDLSVCHRKLWAVHLELGETLEAWMSYQNGLVVAERLAANTKYSELTGHMNPQFALKLYQQDIDNFERAAADQSNEEEHIDEEELIYDCTINLNNLGSSLERLGHRDEAIGCYRRLLAIAEGLYARNPEKNHFKLNVISRYLKLATMFDGDEQQSWWSKAHTALISQVGFGEQLAVTAPENVQFARELTFIYDLFGDLEQAMGNSQAALARYQQGLEIRERLSRSALESADFARDLSVSYWKCATVAAGDEQIQWWRKVHSALITMQERGILAKGDEQYIAEVKTKLGLE